jgi:hypothetical protein
MDQETSKDFSNNSRPYNPQRLHHMMISQGINSRLFRLALLDLSLNLFKIKKEHDSDQFKIIPIRIINNKYLPHQ